MELRIDVRNPVVMAVVVVGLVGGGAWYGWKHPEKLKQVIRSNYDRSAIIDTEKMRVALEDLLLWSRETTATVDYHHFPGGHFYILDQWSAILSIITARLSTQTVMG